MDDKLPLRFETCMLHALRVSADLIDNVLLETFSLCMARENYGS